MVINDERLAKKVQIGKKMCDVAEEVTKTSEIEKFCDAIKGAIFAWRKNEEISEKTAYEEVIKAGNELYLLLDYAVRNFDLEIGLKDKTTQIMSLWFETLDADESNALSAYIASVPYNFS